MKRKRTHLDELSDKFKNGQLIDWTDPQARPYLHVFNVAREKCDWKKSTQEKASSLDGLFAYAKCKPRKALSQGYVKQRRAGRYLERRVLTHQQSCCHIRKLPHENLPFDTETLRPYVCTKDIEIDFETGEEIIYNDDIRFMRERAKSRLDNLRAVRQACNNFKWLVRANERQIRLFVTLTYAENMTDTKRLYNDFRSFWIVLKKHVPKVTGYLVAMEPQKRGAWHAHMMLLSKDPFLRIPNSQINEWWGRGFTKVQRVNNVNDVGAYLTAYLTNMKEGERTKKGARLGLYPAGFRFVRHSKQINSVKETSWFGDATRKIDFDTYELLYDYENIVQVSEDFSVYNRRFCFVRKKKIKPDKSGLDVQF